MKNALILIIIVMAAILVTGCSISKEPFDDQNLILKVVGTKTSDYQITESIKLTNQTEFDLENLSIILSYPLKKEDTYDDEASNSSEVFSLKSGETLTIPIQVHFGNLNTVDLDNPEIKVNGNVIQGFGNVPFGIVGSLNVITDDR